MEQREYIVEAEGAGQRIDRFLSGEDTGLSRSALQGLVAEGHVLCNGKAPAKSLKLKAGDIILLEIPDAKPIEAVPQEIPLDIIYEDAHLLVVNKPKGMVVHPAPGNPDGTLVNALLWHCKGSLSGIGGEIRPGIVHRIDKDTSGLLVVAKDDATHIGLSQQMAVHSVERAYRTIVYGGFAQDEGFVESNLGRSKTDRKKMAVYPASEPHTKYAYTGYKVKTYRNVYSGDGKLISSTFEASSNYKARNRIVLVGKSAAVTPTDPITPVDPGTTTPTDPTTPVDPGTTTNPGTTTDPGVTDPGTTTEPPVEQERPGWLDTGLDR